MTNSQNRKKWQMLHEDNRLRNQFKPEIKDSWDRCYQYGLNPYLRGTLETGLKKPDSSPNTRFFLETAVPIAEAAVGILTPGSTILLFDSQGYVLKVSTSQEIQGTLAQFGLGEGSCWAEELIGTNAVTLGLALAQPVSVVGCEHFCRFAIEYGCAFAPVIDQREVVGGLCILYPAAAYNPNILSTAVVLTQYTVAVMAGDRWNNVLSEAINEGVLGINDQNLIVYMNKSCHRILKTPYPINFPVHLSDIIDITKPENFYIWKAIENGHGINDESVVIMVGKEKVHCTLNISPIILPERGFSGRIMVIQEVERINRLIRNYVGSGARLTFQDVVGRNARFLQVKDSTVRAASSDSNVLLLGESGTGKDVFAQAIHNDSPRRNGPFLAINCAALPRELIASELFGYEDGAFTGAKKGGNVGKFELAHQGTIFLDEIGDMPVDLQATLLRVIEEKRVMRLGGSKSVPVNVRIIAATNKDLEAEMARNRFRRDLFYRLGVIRIDIPPLRERLDDIALLADHFYQAICKRLNKPFNPLSPEVIEAFQKYAWPGNVRELQNVLEGLVQISLDSQISVQHVAQYLAPSVYTAALKAEPETKSFDRTQKDVIMSYLKEFDFNKAKTARALGISRKTLYKRLKDYNITESGKLI